jgi:hypothetical protein
LLNYISMFLGKKFIFVYLVVTTLLFKNGFTSFGPSLMSLKLYDILKDKHLKNSNLNYNIFTYIILFRHFLENRNSFINCLIKRSSSFIFVKEWLFKLSAAWHFISFNVIIVIRKNNYNNLFNLFKHTSIMYSIYQI